jgi:hypothetical protein
MVKGKKSAKKGVKTTPAKKKEAPVKKEEIPEENKNTKKGKNVVKFKPGAALTGDK